MIANQYRWFLMIPSTSSGTWTDIFHFSIIYKWFIKYTSHTHYCYYEHIKKLSDENFRVIYDKFANDYKHR